MPEPIVYIDRSRIRDGKLEEVRGASGGLVERVEESQPQLLSYGFHVDEGSSEMTVVAIHPDAASLERHIEMGAEAFRAFGDLIDLVAIEVYGEPGERALELLHRKARMLGEDARVVVQPLHAGFARFEAPEAPDGAGEEVRVLTGAELREATGTPGLHRRVAFEADGYWHGHVEADPSAMSGWHHHGRTTTVGYVLEGRVRFEYGPGGGRSVEVGPGKYFMVPPHLVHREGNLTDQPAQVVLARVGQGPPVFAVDGPDPA